MHFLYLCLKCKKLWYNVEGCREMFDNKITNIKFEYHDLQGVEGITIIENDVNIFCVNKGIIGTDRHFEVVCEMLKTSLENIEKKTH